MSWETCSMMLTISSQLCPFWATHIGPVLSMWVWDRLLTTPSECLNTLIRLSTTMMIRTTLTTEPITQKKLESPTLTNTSSPAATVAWVKFWQMYFFLDLAEFVRRLGRWKLISISWTDPSDRRHSACCFRPWKQSGYCFLQLSWCDDQSLCQEPYQTRPRTTLLAFLIQKNSMILL